MGLKLDFEAIDVLDYQRKPWYYSMLNPLWNTWGEAYFEGLLYWEASASLPTLWVDLEPNKYSKVTYKVMGNLNTMYWPSWSVKQWKFDSKYGYNLHPTPGSDNDFPYEEFRMGLSGRAYYDAPYPYGWKPDSRYLISNVGHVVLSGGTKLSQAPDGNLFMTCDHGLLGYKVYTYDWSDTMAWYTEVPSIGLSTDWRPDTLAWGIFNMDFGADRVCFTDYGNSTYAYLYTARSREYITVLKAPSYILAISMNSDGYIYLSDDLGWITIYTYDGVYLGSAYQPLTPGVTQYSTQWDPYNKRILRLEFTPDDPTGACTMRIKGYVPLVQDWYLTAPIVRKAPQAKRPNELLSHLSGEGGEPLSGRSAILTGDVTGKVPSDTAGDIVVPFTPTSAGQLDVTVTVGD